MSRAVNIDLRKNFFEDLKCLRRRFFDEVSVYTRSVSSSSSCSCSIEDVKKKKGTNEIRWRDEKCSLRTNFSFLHQEGSFLRVILIEFVKKS